MYNYSKRTIYSKAEDISFRKFIDCAGKKAVVLFGVGRYLPIAKKLLSGHGINPAYAVDNNFWKNGKCVDGIEIRSLDSLISQALNENICVLICADDLFSIEHQLRQFGIKHIFALPLFIDELYKKDLYINAEIPVGEAMARNANEINIMLANKCNLRCSMCRHAQNSSGEVMSMERYLFILEQCRDLRIMGSKLGNVRLDGNREALLHPEFNNILRETKSKGYKTRLVTNGVLLSDKSSTALTEYCSVVDISVTGITPETYSHFQGSNSPDVTKQFNKVVKNVAELVKSKNCANSECKINVSFIYSKHSAHEAKDAVFFWKSVGVDMFYLNPDTGEIASKLENANESEVEYHGYPHGAGMCVRRLTVASNGDVYPCCLPCGEYIPIGNCFDTPLSELLCSPEYFRLINGLASLDRKRIPPGCRTCGVIADIKSTVV